MNSIPVTPPAGRDGRSCRLADRPKRHDIFGRHRPVLSKLGNELSKYLSDQPRAFFFGGHDAAPFQFFTFHTTGDSRGRPQ